MPYVVVAYDISDDVRRLRVARILKNVLDRVQRSVFEGELEEVHLERAETRARRLLDEDTDSLRVYSLCVECRRKIRVYGRGVILEDPDVYIV